ncbi:MAG TPA: peptide deformylase [Iamia sp.]|nr:peptide deformylase [Iamia sp.]
MARKKAKGRGDVEHVGRVTLSSCPVRGGDEPCAPLNRLTVWPVEGGPVKEWCTCSCGRRFPTSHPDAAEHLVAPLDPGQPFVVEPGRSETWTGDDVWPADEHDERAAVGVAPVETPVLHRPTEPVGRITPAIRTFAKHMVKVMHRAPGVGLAANQVGAPLRMFVQVHKRAMPEVVVDPEVRATEGRWTFTEGCLSLEVEGTHARLDRPKFVQVRGRTVHGDVIEVTADEVVARICQHEIDHLDGIEYVQRLVGEAHDRVYEIMATDGIDTTVFPERPY